MAGTLFVVATPIGHLDDITLRALRVLKEVAVVAAEDTRRTGNLLRHYGIPTKLVSLHQHNEVSRSKDLIERLIQGDSIAVATDAGTPGIADPGAKLVRQARHAGVRVEAVPGPSAVSAAISLSGLEDTPFTFLGFPPVRSNDRKQWFSRVERLRAESALVFFEAPHRIQRTLGDLSFLGNQSILAFRELTKVHEEALEGPVSVLADALSDPKGEFTVVIPRYQPDSIEVAPATDEELGVLFDQLVQTCEAANNREAARLVGKRFGLSTRDVYQRLKKSPR